MKNTQHRYSVKILYMLLAFILLLPLFGGTAVAAVSIPMESASEYLSTSETIFGYNAVGTLIIGENDATATITYGRPCDMSVHLFVKCGFGDKRYEYNAVASNTIGGASCTAGSESIISSKILYANAEYFVKVENGTATLSWTDSLKWGDINL